jgi:exodeoxyribonuclease VII large subunit
MSGTYLVTTYADKDSVKALGARWDPARKQWYVLPGHDIAPFSEWLPTGTAAPLKVAALSPERTEIHPATEVAVSQKGISLSRLLGGVSQAVTDAFKAGAWTLVEVVDTRVRGGHVYLEVSERDDHGTVVAKAAAVIWATQANRILPAFQSATGVQLGPGIKLLVRARPVFKAQYGFSLELDAIDAEYTLGDLEARKRDIRERLQREGLFELNKKLPCPWDYRHVLVIAPQGGAGLGDFQAEATRLEAHGVCSFIYAYSRFQGEGAAFEISVALSSALEQINLNHSWRPDAVVIIRGGGAVNDLAWLNDYGLVRTVCELDIPVLTGIGHERDSTVLDEVSNFSFDTPSKVIAHIEQTIVQRTREASDFFAFVTQRSQRITERARRASTQTFTAIEGGARQAISFAQQRVAEHMSDIKIQAVSVVHSASDITQQKWNEVQHLSQQHLHIAKREAPALIAEIKAEATQALKGARMQSEAEWQFITERATVDLKQESAGMERALDSIAERAKKSLVEARARSLALMREIAGQGPEKTLQRGFAFVRDDTNQVVTSASTLQTTITIEFRDGIRIAELKGEQP